jgi:alpha-L-fucosidase 2
VTAEENPLLIDRRTMMGSALAIAAAATPARSELREARPDPQRLWYRQPAGTWNEALPIGNGRLGAMVFGRIGQERLQLNETTLWSGRPYTPDNPDALAALPQVRALIAEGRYKEADKLAGARMMAKPLSQMAYGSLGDLLIDFPAARAPIRYERELDLSTSLAALAFDTPEGRFRREAFASYPDQVIVLSMDAMVSRLDFALSYRGPRKVDYPSPDYGGPATETLTAAVKWLDREAAGILRPDIIIRPDGPRAIMITGRNEPGPIGEAGLAFALRVEVVGDGIVDATPAGLNVRGAKRAALMITAATSFVSFDRVDGDPAAEARRVGMAAVAKGVPAIRRAHIADYQRLFSKVTLHLGSGRSDQEPTDSRVAAAETSDDPTLAALYFQFGRYLLISASRAGGQPANLQGIWNEGVNPPWGSKYTININTEMNYWPADPAALGECVEPLVRMVEDISVTGARTAHVMYGARGWVAHHNTDLWRATAPIDGPFSGMWPCGGAWLCNTLWAHWDYLRDERLLARLYPLLRGASLFFLDTMIEDPGGRGLITSPSISPENQHPFGSAVCAGPAMDRQIIRDLFTHTIEAATLLGVDPQLMSALERSRARIAPDRIGHAGQLQEWLEDWDKQAPEVHHRHVSHLYGVYPSGQINVRDTPDLIAAAKITLNDRGDLTTGWGTAWRACLWARMGDGERAHRILRGLLGPRRTYPNLFDAHPPFQIDGNFGGSAAIMEMLVQSWGGEVWLLPALPEAWPDGYVTGLKVRGNITVSLKWRQGRLREVRLAGPPGTTARLNADAQKFHVVLDDRGSYAQAWA